MDTYRRVGSGLAVVLAVMVAAAPALADGPDAYGLGSRGAALGSALGAGTDDWTSAYYNPAGIASVRHLSTGIGVNVGVDHLQDFHDVVLGYDQSTGAAITGPVSTKYDNVVGFTFGAAMPLTKRLFVGVSMWAPGARLVRIMTLDAFVPHYGMYVNRAQRITPDFVLAYRVTPRLRLGAGISSLAQSNFNQDFNIPAGQGSDSNSSRALISLDILPTIIPLAGVQYDVSPAVTMGLGYRGAADLQVHVQQASGADVVFPLGPSLRFHSKVDITGGFVIFDHFTPQQLVLGGKWDKGHEAPVALFFDATYMNWSSFRGPYIDPNFDPIVVPPLGTVAVNWRHPPKAGFRDTVVPRIGAEWRLGANLALRGGYSYEMTPAPAATGDANLLDADSHVLSAGAGVKFHDPTHYVKEPIELNLHARLRQLVTTTAKKSVTYDCNDPNQHPPVGYPCSGQITAAGQVISGGADLEFQF